MKLGPYTLGPDDDGNCGIYTGDALQGMNQIPDSCIDAVITDPPYCAGAISEGQRTRAIGQGLRSDTIRRFGWFVGDNMGTAGLSWLLRSIGLEAIRVLRASGSLLVFIDWRMIPYLVPAIESSGLRYQGLIVWDKGSFGLGLGFRRQHEMIAHFTTGAPEYHNAATGDVICVRRVSGTDRKHQTQKPTELCVALTRVVTPERGIVLDPFAGSGTTCVAARQLGRQWLAFEIDPDVAERARERVRNTQPPLYVAEIQQEGMAL